MENAAASENQVSDTQNTDVSGLSEAIQESKTVIEEAAAPKNKGGRPRKKRDENGNIIPGETEPAKPKTAKAATIAVPAIPPEYLKPAVNFPFALAARRTGFDGWNLTDKEQLDNAILLEKCMARYFPQLESAHAELVGLSLGLGFAAYGRFLSYNEFKQARYAPANSQTGEERNTENTSPKPADSKIDKILKKQKDSGVKPSPALSSLLDGP